MNVFERFSKVQAAMAHTGIDKGMKNKQQGYAYRGIDQVMNAVGPILAEANVLVMPSVQNHNMVQGKTKSGGVSFHHTVEVEYMIYGPEGDSLGPFKSRGECIDTSDKGLNKACTAAYKYWVLTALCVPTEGDDADSDTPEAGDSNVYETINQDQQNTLIKLMMESNTEAPEFLAYLNVMKLADLAVEHFPNAKRALEMKLEKMSKEYAEGEARSARSES